MFEEVYVEQRSAEWLAFRETHIMASDAPIILGVSKYKEEKDLFEEKLGIRTQERKMTSSMKKGVEKEKYLLDLFNTSLSDKIGREVRFRPAVVKKMQSSFPRGASLDGVSEDFKEAVEIKVTNKKNHELARNGGVPDEFIPQLHHQMEVLDLGEIWYLSYFIPADEAIIMKVKRREEVISYLMEKEENFWKILEDLKNV